MSPALDPWLILGIPRDASLADVKRAYRRRAFQTHPDRKTGNEEEFKRVGTAYEILKERLQINSGFKTNVSVPSSQEWEKHRRSAEKSINAWDLVPDWLRIAYAAFAILSFPMLAWLGIMSFTAVLASVVGILLFLAQLFVPDLNKISTMHLILLIVVGGFGILGLRVIAKFQLDSIENWLKAHFAKNVT